MSTGVARQKLPFTENVFSRDISEYTHVVVNSLAGGSVSVFHWPATLNCSPDSYWHATLCGQTLPHLQAFGTQFTRELRLCRYCERRQT